MLFLLLAAIDQAHAGQGFTREVEPNDSAANATPIPGTSAVLLGNLMPGSDTDVYSFTAGAGDRVYAATMTASGSISAFNTQNSVLEVLDASGVTVIELDDDDGFFPATSSSIAGATLQVSGNYFLRVRANPVASQMRPYHLHFQLRTGAPVPETEPNAFGSPQSLAVSGWQAGATGAADVSDAYRIALNAGDTVYASLDLNPNAAGGWNGRVGITAINGTAPVAYANDASSGDARPSEALFWTVAATGLYDIVVDSSVGAVGGYQLSVSVLPNAPASPTCTTYSNDTATTLPTGPGETTSAIFVPGNPRVADIDVDINLAHSNLGDLDVQLLSPADNENGLFSDVTGSTTMNLRLDDEAAIPLLGSVPAITVYNGVALQPELNYRLSWFDGENAGGTWTLKLRDDSAGNGGTLSSWQLTICEAAPPACPAGTALVSAFTQDFESGDGSFVASGTSVNWAYGTPQFIPIVGCNSGFGCWTTSLGGFYDPSSDQVLVSPPISLVAFTGTLFASWAQKYQVRDAALDQITAEVRQLGGANPRRLFEHTAGNMQDSVGSPTTTVDESAGWGVQVADVSAFAGQNVEFAFRLVSSAGTVSHAGYAIDDLVISRCQPIVDALFANGFE